MQHLRTVQTRSLGYLEYLAKIYCSADSAGSRKYEMEQNSKAVL